MDEKKLSAAISEAARFIQVANRLIARNTEDKQSGYVFCTTREGGACRRASLDLTMALADLRRRGT